MDLSWSYNLRTDAPTIVKNLRKEVRKHMDFISYHMSNFDNVSIALNSGEKILGGILCRKCNNAVRSKRTELHSKNETVQKKKKLQKLSPERQQILNEITNNFIKLERSENEDEGEEYCTEGEYYREEMLAMESMYRNMLYDKQDEMAEIENKHKKEIQDKETELKKLANDRDEFKKKIDSISKKFQPNDKIESELRELKRQNLQLNDELEKNENELKKLKKCLNQKEEDKRYRPSSSEHRMRQQTNDQDHEISRLKEELDLRVRELQISKKENENLNTEKNEVTGRLEGEQRSLREVLEKKCDELNAVKSQLDVFEKAREMQKKLETLLNENERAGKEIQELQKGKQTLQDQTDSLKKITEELSSTLKTKEQDVNNLRGELDEKQEAFDKIHEEKDACMREVSQLQAERQTLQDETDSLNKTVGDLSSTLKTKEYNIDQLTRKQDKIQKETDRHATDISQIDQEKQILQGQTYSLTKTIKEMASVIETQQKEVETLKKSFDETQTELEEVQMENEKNAKDKFQLQSERKSMMDKLFSIKYGMDEMSSTTEGLQQDIAAFLTELVKGDGKSSFEESRRFKRKAVVMRLLCTSRSGLGKIMVDMVTKELTRQLGGRQDLRKFEISIVLPNTSKGVSKGPLFVVCLNTMVLKHVPDALEGPKGGKDVYLLVLHQTTRENLSTLRPDSLRNTGSELRQLGGVIDMVFSSESGLFECNINNTAFEQITTVLKKY